jgi:cytoskeletal protein CcmA (bactofilin family)
MTLFSKRPKPVTERSTNDEGYSVLDAKLTIFGDIETDGTVRIEGRLQGSVRRADAIILGNGAVVQGNVSAREVIVGGAVEGNINAAERVELQPTAVVTGDIEAGAILIKEGGAVRGRLCIRALTANAPAANAPVASAVEPKPQAEVRPRAPSLTPRAMMRLTVPAAAPATGEASS